MVPVNLSLSGHPLLYASHRFQTESYNQEEQHEQRELHRDKSTFNGVEVVTILQISCFGTRSSGDCYLKMLALHGAGLSKRSFNSKKGIDLTNPVSTYFNKHHLKMIVWVHLL